MKKELQSNVNGMTSGGGSIQHPFSIHSASIGSRWKLHGLSLMMTILLLFTMGIGQMWGTWQTTTVDATLGTRDSISTDGLTREWSLEAKNLSANDVSTSHTALEAHNAIQFMAGGSGKQKFVKATSGLSSKNNSNIYIPVPIGSAGTITMSVYSDSEGRWLQLYTGKTNTEAAATKRMYSKQNATPTGDSGKEKGPRFFSFTATDTTMINGVAYLHFKDNNTEMKISGFSVVLTTGSYPVAADVTAPTLSSSDPADGATGVAVSGNIVLTFSENVTVNDASKFSLSGGEGSLTTASISVSGAAVTIPYTGLENNTTYTFSAAAGAVKDAANNTSAALDDISFTTVAAETPTCPSGISISGTADYTEGETIELTAALEAGNGDITYTWYKGSIEVGNEVGTNSNELTIASCATSDAGDYFCVASKDACSNATSTAYAVTVAAAPTCPEAGEVVYKLQMKTSDMSSVNFNGTGTVSNDYISEQTGGVIKYKASSSGKAKLNGNSGLQLTEAGPNSYFQIDLDCPLKVGDIITWAITSNSFYLMKGTTYAEATDLTLARDVSTTITLTSTFVDANNIKTIYIGKGSGNGNLSYIEIIRPYKVTLNANGGNVNGQSSSVEYLTEATVLPRAFKSTERFIGWYDAQDAGNLIVGPYAKYTPTTDDVTLYAHYTNDCPSAGSMYSFEIGTAPTSDVKAAANSTLNLVDYASCTSGTAEIGNNSTSQNAVVKNGEKKVTLSSNANSYLLLEFGCPLEAGDVVTFNKSNKCKISYTYNAASGTTASLASGTNTFEIPSESGWVGERRIYVFYDGTGVTVTSATVTRPAVYTATLAPDGGSTSAEGWTLSAGVYTKSILSTAAQTLPTMTREGYKFDKWTANQIVTIGETPVAVGGDIAAGASVKLSANTTFTAHWNQTFAVTYAKGDEGADGTMTDSNSPYVEGADVTLLANTFTAPSGKEFDEWVVTKTASGDPVSVTAGKFSMPAEAVTVTATWKDLADKYTVIFKDGTTELGTKQFVVSTNPSDDGIGKTKPLNTFAAWQKDAADIALDDAFWATVAKDAEVTLTARWTKLYATSYDMEAYAASDGASKAGLETALTAAHYAYTNINGIDNDHTHNYTYDGMKYKTNDGDLSFNVVAGKVVEVKTGHLPSNNAVTMYINGVADATVFEGADEASETHKINYFYSAVEALYRLEVLASKGTCSVKKVTIRDPYEVSYDADGGDPVAAQYGEPSVTLPSASKGTSSLIGWFDGETKVGEAGESYTPTANIMLKAHWEAVSTDARLASITFSSAAGSLSPAFDPEVVNYTYTMPYGTAAVPTITGATSVSAKAKTPVIVSQAAAWNETAVIRGVAESDDTKAYNITMKIAPKDPVCLVWADIPSANTLTYNASKSLLNEADVTLAISGVSGKDGSAPSGVKFQKPGYIKIQKNEGTFQIGDIVALDVTYVAGSAMHVFKVQTPSTAADVIGTGTTATTPAGVNKVAITEDAATLWLARPDNESAYKDWNPHVDYVAVYRAMNPVLKSITFDGTKINVTGTSVSKTLPNGADLTAVTQEIFWNGAGTAVVTTNAGAWAWGENTYVLTDKDGDATTYTITLTEDVLKHTVTYYDGATPLGTEEVTHGGHPTATGITAPHKLGFTFQGWSETNGGALVNLSDVTISADDELYAKYAAIDCSGSGTKYKFQLKTDLVDGNVFDTKPNSVAFTTDNYLSVLTGGILTGSIDNNNVNRLQFFDNKAVGFASGSGGTLTIGLDCALAEGDVIKYINYASSGNSATLSDGAHTQTLNGNGSETVQTWTVPAAWDGATELTLVRGGNTPKLTYFEIYRRPVATGATMANLTIRQGQTKTPVLTLEPSDDAIVTSQAWEIVGTPVNLTGAAINATTGAITTGTLNDPASNGTISIKVTLNGSIEATCTATIVDAITQQDVTTSTIWDWHNTGATGNIQLSNTTDPKKNENFVLANVSVNNNDEFESDKLAVEGEYMVRDYDKTNPYFQGQLIQFHTTVAGVVRVKFAHTGDATEEKPARELYINGVATGDTRANATPAWSNYIEVPAGDVSITAHYVNLSPVAAQQYIRVFEIEFLALAHQRTTGYAAGDLGTVCLEDATIIDGANLYELSGLDQYGYMAFDQILSGELEAGKPYLFEVTNPSKISFYKPVGAAHSDDEIAVKGMIGTFAGTTLYQNVAQNYYYFSGRHIWRVNDFTVEIPIPAHRCYVDMDALKNAVASPSPLPGRRRVTLGVNGKNTTTAIDNAEATEAPRKVMINGTLFILRGEKMYDATGRLVK